MLKDHPRIEAFPFVYFLALVAETLIERDIRARTDLRRHRLLGHHGCVQRCSYDILGKRQRAVLRLLKISLQENLAAVEEPAAA